MLIKDIDLAFGLSTDDIDLFRKGKKRQVWPILLHYLNLAPELRSPKDNLYCCGIIPGPDKPVGLDPFLYPNNTGLQAVAQWHLQCFGWIFRDQIYIGRAIYTVIHTIYTVLHTVFPNALPDSEYRLSTP